jgi:hypothetical protein
MFATELTEVTERKRRRGCFITRKSPENTLFQVRQNESWKHYLGMRHLELSSVASVTSVANILNSNAAAVDCTRSPDQMQEEFV